MSGIYIVQNLANGKNYVGQTSRSGVKERYRSLVSPHLCNGRKGHRSIDNAIRKYGASSFNFVDIMKDVPVSELNGWERFWIKLFGSNDRALGYNLDSGGRGGRVVTKEARARMSEIRKRNPNYHKGLALMVERSKARSAAGLPGPKWTSEMRENWFKANEGKHYGHTGTVDIYEWSHCDFGNHVCSVNDLKRSFPDQKLSDVALYSVAKKVKYRHVHKGWKCLGFVRSEKKRKD